MFIFKILVFPIEKIIALIMLLKDFIPRIIAIFQGSHTAKVEAEAKKEKCGIDSEKKK
jgi:hypothetical protein